MLSNLRSNDKAVNPLLSNQANMRSNSQKPTRKDKELLINSPLLLKALMGDDLSDTPDPIVLDRATELGRVIFSQDDDFLMEAHRRQVEGIYFSGVIYVHQRNTLIGDCIRDLE